MVVPNTVENNFMFDDDDVYDDVYNIMASVLVFSQGYMFYEWLEYDTR